MSTLPRNKINDLLTWRLLSCYSDEELPEELLTEVAPVLVKDEDIPVIDKAYVHFLDPASLREYDPAKTVVPLRKMNRRKCEFSTQYVQLVGAVLLHTDKNIVLLRLKRDNPHVDGYTINTLVLPAGHANWSSREFDWTTDIMHFSPGYIMNHVMYNTAYREFSEELTARDDLDYFKLTSRSREATLEAFRMYVRSQMNWSYNQLKIHTGYVNEAASPMRHFLVCYDVYIKDPLWQEMIDEHHFLDAGEPSNHEVMYITPEDVSKYIGWYDIYVKEIFAKTADLWMWKFVRPALPYK